ncbi:MAG TPA: PilN domain-containing protein [Candidatus Saccharimonadales bacterium]
MINLLPPEQKKEYRAARMNTILRQYFTLLLVAIAVVVVIFGGSLYLNMLNKQSYEQILADNNKKLTDLSEVREKTATFNKNISDARKVFNAQISLSDAMVKFAEAMPRGTVLTGLTLDAQSTSKPLNLTARVDSFSKAGVLEANFKASPYFKQVTVASVTNTSGSGSDNRYPYTVSLTVLLDPSIVNPLTKESTAEEGANQ